MGFAALTVHVHEELVQVNIAHSRKLSSSIQRLIQAICQMFDRFAPNPSACAMRMFSSKGVFTNSLLMSISDLSYPNCTESAKSSQSVEYLESGEKTAVNSAPETFEKAFATNRGICRITLPFPSDFKSNTHFIPVSFLLSGP